MNKHFCLILILFLGTNYAFGQIQEIADKTLILKGESNLTANEKLELDTLWNALKFYRKFEQQETKLNGKAKFGFTGNESDLNNIFKINGGVEIDNGIYPFELDLKSNFQTLIRNGNFQENVSDIDISFDYHSKTGNGLFLESFVFLKRFSNTYLGIDQRYDAGAGIILNLFSTKKLTDKGIKNQKELDKLPEYKLVNGNIWKCYDDACGKITASNKSQFKLSDGEIKYLERMRYNYDRANKKKYSKWRLALLAGIYYENEKAKLEQELLFNGVETFFTADFEATNKLRWELRPTLVYKPDDVFTIKIYPYLKYPLTQRLDIVKFNETIQDERVDKFYDIQTSIEAKITKNVAITIKYRYLKDFAPKREYKINANNEPVLIVGQEVNSFYNINFSFGF
jgi:hypothetical protein